MEEQDNTRDATEVAIVEENQVVRRGPYKKSKPKTTFLKTKGHELDKAIKQTARYLPRALETLIHICTNDKADDKERRMAAEAIVTAHYKMIDQKDKDQISRLEKEIDKLGLLGGGSTAEDEEEDDDDTPVLDFDNIHPDFVDVESVLEEKLDNKEE